MNLFIFRLSTNVKVIAQHNSS